MSWLWWEHIFFFLAFNYNIKFLDQRIGPKVSPPSPPFFLSRSSGQICLHRTGSGMCCPVSGLRAKPTLHRNGPLNGPKGYWTRQAIVPRHPERGRLDRNGIPIGHVSLRAPENPRLHCYATSPASVLGTCRWVTWCLPNLCLTFSL
jgi:hypothetical protein